MLPLTTCTQHQSSGTAFVSCSELVMAYCPVECILDLVPVHLAIIERHIDQYNQCIHLIRPRRPILFLPGVVQDEHDRPDQWMKVPFRYIEIANLLLNNARECFGEDDFR